MKFNLNASCDVRKVSQVAQLDTNDAPSDGGLGGLISQA
jgi:hypothetical protein